MQYLIILSYLSNHYAIVRSKGCVYRLHKIQIVCLDPLFNDFFLNYRWPGSTHDQTIFNFSQLRARLENKEFGDGYLLGDAGYCNKNYLLTPLQNPRTGPQLRYNRIFKTARQSVERSYGVWKQTFPILSKSNLK